ncbi:MAG: transcriptional regulator [Gammaproteobacteria bacterium]|nr:MAG: transcriptional regulator [Gammaproteobacteria bacterium]
METKKFNILIVDDEADITDLLGDILQDEGYRVFIAGDAQQGDEIYQHQVIDLVLLDIWMPKEDGLSLLTRWYEAGLKAQVIMMSGHGTIETAVQATKLGAFDFVEKPISLAKLMITVENVCKKINLEKRHQALLQQINPDVKIIGKSPVINELKNQLEQIKSTPLPVLFLGQSGTGKNYYARYLHQLSPHKREAFITVNASALSRDNQRREIFSADGLLQTAEGGTLYVDEVMDLEADTQALFTVLIETGQYSVDNITYSPAVRLCFASQHSLSELSDSTLLKKELFYHIQTIAVKVPALKDYHDDIPEIINHYVYQFVDYENLPYRHFSMQALNFLRQYDWPGNVRELKNFVQRVLVLSEEEEISLSLVEKLLHLHRDENQQKNDMVSIDLPIRDAREQFEKAYFISQLEYCQGNIAKLAERAGLERTNLYRKLKSLGIQYK